jgi:hypothetical protein
MKLFCLISAFVAVAASGRCGPLFDNTKCTGTYSGRTAPEYCNEGNGWCGTTSAHKNAQASTAFDYVPPTESSANFQLWSGGCNQHSTGSGWSQYCLDGVDQNTAQAALSVANNELTVKERGFYRVHAWADQHGQGGTYRAEIQRNGNSIMYTHQYKNIDGGWTQVNADITWMFEVGDTIRVRYHADSTKGNTYKWHSWNAKGQHSRLQVEYLGADARIWSGGCSQHSQGSGWSQYCLDGVDQNTAQAELSVANNELTVKKRGFYRVHAWADQHGQGGTYRAEIQRNGQSIMYTFQYKNIDGGWTQVNADITWMFEVGDTIRVRYHADSTKGNVYKWHAWNAKGQHSRLQVEYHADAHIWSGGCNQHSQGSGWSQYCLNSVDQNTAQAELSVANNELTVKERGFYRVHAWAIQHGQGGHYRAEIQRNGQSIMYTHQYKNSDGGWTQINADVTWFFEVGDTIRVRYHADSTKGNVYKWHSWNAKGQHSRLQVEFRAGSGPDGVTVRVCTCIGGVAATGSSCSLDGANICGSCNNGYFLNGKSCSAWRTCPKGQGVLTAGSASADITCEACTDADKAYSADDDRSACADHVQCAAGFGSNWSTLANSEKAQSKCVPCTITQFSSTTGYGPCSTKKTACPVVGQKLVASADSTSDATCTATHCTGASTTAPTNGSASASDGSKHGSTATFACDAGFLFSGTRSVTCVAPSADAPWSAPAKAPACYHTQPLPDPALSVLFDGAQFGVSEGCRATMTAGPPKATLDSIGARLGAEAARRGVSLSRRLSAGGATSGVVTSIDASAAPSAIKACETTFKCNGDLGAAVRELVAAAQQIEGGAQGATAPTAASAAAGAPLAHGDVGSADVALWQDGGRVMWAVPSYATVSVTCESAVQTIQHLAQHLAQISAAPLCHCANGGHATGAACAQHGDHACESCGAGYRLTGNRCVRSGSCGCKNNAGAWLGTSCSESDCGLWCIAGDGGFTHDCTKHGNAGGCENQRNLIGKTFCRWSWD